MELAERIEQLITPALKDLGYGIVRVILSGVVRKTLQIMIERLDQAMVSIDDCTKASRTISALMDVEDPMTQAYVLEVSSPGLDRPLVKLADYERFVNHEVKLETRAILEGIRRFHGIITDVQDQTINIKLLEPVGTQDQFSIPFTLIQKCKLVPHISFKKKEEGRS